MRSLYKYLILLPAVLLCLLPAHAQFPAPTFPAPAGSTPPPATPAQAQPELFYVALKHISPEQLAQLLQKGRALHEFVPAGIVSIAGVKGTQNLLIKSTDPGVVISFAQFLTQLDQAAVSRLMDAELPEITPLLEQPSISATLQVVITEAKQFTMAKGGTLSTDKLNETLRGLLLSRQGSVLMLPSATLQPGQPAVIALPPLLPLHQTYLVTFPTDGADRIHLAIADDAVVRSVKGKMTLTTTKMTSLSYPLTPGEARFIDTQPLPKQPNQPALTAYVFLTTATVFPLDGTTQPTPPPALAPPPNNGYLTPGGPFPSGPGGSFPGGTVQPPVPAPKADK